MTREQIEKKIEFYKSEIEKDLKKMEENPNEMYWGMDFNINNSMLAAYQTKLRECEE